MRKLAAILVITVNLHASLFYFERRAVAQTTTTAAAANDRLSTAQAKKVIEGRAREVVRAIKSRNMQRLSSFVHPQKGVRFSPYVYVDLESDRVFSGREVRNFSRNNRRYLWGHYDGSGNPIRLTPKQYFNRFAYRQDFLRAREIGYNTKSARGNTINNAFDMYPRAILVEYYLPGSNPKYNGMDWSSLWLVFEKQNGVWYLVGVFNDEWTT